LANIESPGIARGFFVPIDDVAQDRSLQVIAAEQDTKSTLEVVVRKASGDALLALLLHIQMEFT